MTDIKKEHEINKTDREKISLDPKLQHNDAELDGDNNIRKDFEQQSRKRGLGSSKHQQHR